MAHPAGTLSLRTCTPILRGAAFAVGLGLHYLLGRPFLLPLPYPYPIFAVVSTLGLALAVWAFICFLIAKTPWEPHTTPCAMVTKGPFCISRNPAYLGALVLMIGVAWWARGVLVFLTPLLFFIVMNWYLIPLEERKMESCFGEEYARYRRTVRRWI